MIWATFWSWFRHLFAPRAQVPAEVHSPVDTTPAPAPAVTLPDPLTPPPSPPPKPAPPPAPVYPGHVPTTAEILLQGRQTLRQALADRSVQASDDSVDRLLGIAWAESRLGLVGSWAGSNNWGAVHLWNAAWGPFLHADLDANGSPIQSKFQQYPSQLDGAKGFLMVILRGKVPSALVSGTSSNLARAMYANGYFTGVHGAENPEANIADYARMIDGGLSAVRQAIGGAGPLPAPTNDGPSGHAIVLPLAMGAHSPSAVAPVLVLGACVFGLALLARRTRSNTLVREPA